MIVALGGWTRPAQAAAAGRARAPGAVRAALSLRAATPELAVPLALMALVGTLGFNFQVILPLLARFTFDGGASAYAALVCAMGLGSVVGALVTGARGRTGPGLIAARRWHSATALLAAAMPSLALEIPVLALLGAASVTFAASVNSTPAARCRPADAGPRDGALLDRLPRLDADRGPARGLALADLRPARRAAARRLRRARGRLGGAPRLGAAGETKRRGPAGRREGGRPDALTGCRGRLRSSLEDRRLPSSGIPEPAG